MTAASTTDQVQAALAMLDAGAMTADVEAEAAHREAGELQQKMAEAEARETAARKLAAQLRQAADVLRPVGTVDPSPLILDREASGGEPAETHPATDAPRTEPGARSHAPSTEPNASVDNPPIVVAAVDTGDYNGKRRRLPSVEWVTDIVAEAQRPLRRDEILAEMDVRGLGVGAWKNRTNAISTAISRARDLGRLIETLDHKFVTASTDSPPNSLAGSVTGRYQGSGGGTS